MTQDTKVDWGAPIPVNGKRPEWLADRAHIQWGDVNGEPDWKRGSNYVKAESADARWFWHDIEYIRLPADHPYYTQPTPTNEARERMEKLVRHMASVDPQSRAAKHNPSYEEARAIAALLDPVDGDERVAKRIAEDMPDASPADLVLAGMKAIRDLERQPEVECQHVWGPWRGAQDYRERVCSKCKAKHTRSGADLLVPPSQPRS